MCVCVCVCVCVCGCLRLTSLPAHPYDCVHATTYLAQHPSAGRPAQALAQAVEEPERGKGGHGGGPGENHVDAPHQEQANGEEPAGADPVRQHAADELTDGVGQGLAAGDHAWRQTVVTGTLSIA